MMHKNHKMGMTLQEVMIAVVVITILAVIAHPSYRSYIRKSRLSAVQQLMLDNAQAWERHYAAHGHYRQTSRKWAALPVQGNDIFCIRPQGAPRGATHNGQYSLKAVALDKTKEPRVLVMNQDLTFLLCEESSSTCAETEYFANPARADKNCRSYP